MRQRLLKILGISLGVAGLAAIAVGCGGGGDSTTVVLTKSQFIKQADAICEHADAEQEATLQAYAKEHPESVGNKALESKSVQEDLVLVVGLPPLQAEAEEIGALGAPQGDADQVKAIVVGMEKAVAEGEEDPLSMTAETGGPFAPVNKLAKAYGLKACADAS